MEWVELGRIGSPYGVLGWMHIQSFTEPPEGVLDYPVWGLRLGAGAANQLPAGGPDGFRGAAWSRVWKG